MSTSTLPVTPVVPAPGAPQIVSPAAGGVRPRSGRLSLEPGPSFVASARVQEITRRALTYLEIGYPVHLAGPAGTGKTTLAFHIAAQMGRPASDLIGKDAGYRKSTLVDNYIHSVLKTEEKVNVHWVDNKLTQACEQGHTLIYDEFNRTPPEANNTLLSILEERSLNLPRTGGGDGYLRVHPEFRAIFTSNPEEYAGVHKTQDALLDRLITIYVDHYDAATEVDITSAKGGVDVATATYIVEMARVMRRLAGNPHRPTIRACIAVAKVVSHRGISADPGDEFFRAVCFDVLNENAGDASRRLSTDQMDRLIDEVHGVLTGRRPAPAGYTRETPAAEPARRAVPRESAREAARPSAQAA